MQFRLASLVLAIGVACAALPAAAADNNGKFLIKGLGTQSCSDYLKFSQTDKLITETWWAGYLTALNRTTEDTYNLLGETTPAQANAWLEDYCSTYNNRLIATAVHAMLQHYFPNREETSPNN